MFNVIITLWCLAFSAPNTSSWSCVYAALSETRLWFVCHFSASSKLCDWDEVCSNQGSYFASRDILVKTVLPWFSNNLHWCFLPASVLADEVLDLSVVSDFKNDLVEVVILLNVAEVQRARLEIFCLSSALTTGKNWSIYYVIFF